MAPDADSWGVNKATLPFAALSRFRRPPAPEATPNPLLLITDPETHQKWLAADVRRSRLAILVQN